LRPSPARKSSARIGDHHGVVGLVALLEGAGGVHHHRCTTTTGGARPRPTKTSRRSPVPRRFCHEGSKVGSRRRWRPARRGREPARRAAGFRCSYAARGDPAGHRPATCIVLERRPEAPPTPWCAFGQTAGPTTSAGRTQRVRRHVACSTTSAGRTQRVRRHVACSTTSAGRTQRLRRHVACSTTSAGGVASRARCRPRALARPLPSTRPPRCWSPGLGTSRCQRRCQRRRRGRLARGLYRADFATKAPRSDPGVGGDRREEAESLRDGLPHRAGAAPRSATDTFVRLPPFVLCG